MKISIIIPFYNEEANIEQLFRRLEIVMNSINVEYEIICVNDGSKDNTLEYLIQHHIRNSVIKIVSLSRNFGKEIALSAGLDYSIGDAVIPIDADLQDPPELIEQLIEKWQEGYDVVYATRRYRWGESWLKQVTANNFYLLMEKYSSIPIPRNTGDFRLMDRRVVDAIKRLPERTRFMKGLFSWVGYKQTAIIYDRSPRYQGVTKWNYWSLWNFAIDGITSFSSLPLRIWTYIGCFLSFLAFLYAIYLIIRTFIFGIDVPGYASLMVTILFVGGIQLINLGIIGEYIGRIYDEVKARPLYLVRDVYGFDNSQDNTNIKLDQHSS